MLTKQNTMLAYVVMGIIGFKIEFKSLQVQVYLNQAVFDK